MSTLNVRRESTTKDKVVPAGGVEVKPAKAVKVWAALGLFFVALQAYVWIRWATGPDFGPLHADADDIPTSVKAAAWGFQILTALALIGCIGWVLRQVVKERRLTFDALLLIGWASVAWQDPIINYVRPQFLYNSYMINVGSWGGYIPGWISPNVHNLPQPILLTGLGYMFCLAFSVGVCAAMRAAKRRFPSIGVAGLIAVAVAASAALDLAYEAAMVLSRVVAYSGGIHELSIFAGKTYQFPVYEALLWGCVWGASGALRYFRDDKGRSVVERGSDALAVSERTRTAIRALAVIGFLNVAYVVYNVCINFIALQIDQTPTGYPTWIRNEICGAGTEFACPGPDVPIPINGNVTQPDPASTG